MRHGGDWRESHPTPAEKARRMVESWLEWAISQPDGSLPRIPLRKVSEGGYTVLSATSSGRTWATRWWIEALEVVEERSSGAGFEW